ncbi:MAG: hypothetical protein RIT44_734 [Pseudomonadota bacterium]
MRLPSGNISVPLASKKPASAGFLFLHLRAVAPQWRADQWLACLPVLTICMAEAMSPDTSDMLPGTMSVVLAS